MKKRTLKPKTIIFLCFVILLISNCSKKHDNETNKPSDVWDIDKDGYPKFVNTNYIELDKIYEISKFRSSFGHDYSDAFEHCRSMKHYFEPKSDIDWTTVRIYSPIKGIITRAEEEWAGTHLEIESEDYPAFRIQIFHINTLKQYNLNDKVSEGELLGTHIGSQTMSDISIIVNDPTKQGRMVSYFEIITDSIFNLYSARGVSSRETMIISKELRDANTLTCSGDTFISSDTLQNWVVLK